MYHTSSAIQQSFMESDILKTWLQLKGGRTSLDGLVLARPLFQGG